MRITLTPAVSAGIVFDAVEVDNVIYDPDARQYTANVYGVVEGNVIPLAVFALDGFRRINTSTVTDSEIDALLAVTGGTSRTDAAIQIAIGRLYQMMGIVPA